MQTLLHDFRFALRQLRKSPGFTVTTTLTLALGIGATAAIFSLINAVVLRPLPFPEPDRIVWVQQKDPSLGSGRSTTERLSYPDFLDWRAQNHSFSDIASYRASGVTLTGSGDPQHLDGGVVSSDFFRVLGIHPLFGRDFLPLDEKPGSRVVMLSYHLWQSTFGGAQDVIGRSITLDARSYLVAGIMPANFGFPYGSRPPVLWKSIAEDFEDKSPLGQQRGADSMVAYARLKPGVSVSQALADVTIIARRLAAQYPDTNKPFTAAVVEPELDNLVGDSRPALRLLFAAVTLVLLIACANVAGLLLARASRRRSEIAVRAALGASRFEIVRQILVEAVALALCGGALGILFSGWILDTLLHLVPQSLPRADQIAVDGTMLAFVTVVSLVSGLLFGVLPAWRMSRLDPSFALREGGRGAAGSRGQNRLQGWLVIAETALGLVLLIGSGLLLRSFVRVVHVDPGFDAQNVLTADLNLPERQFTQEQQIQFYQRMFPRLGALPGVQSVAAGWPLPLAESNIGVSFQIEGHPTDPGDSPTESINVVTPGYFHTMRIPILAGRDFDDRDGRMGKPVIIVNQKFAHKYFPGVNAVGKHMRSDLSDSDDKPPMREIVAVVGDVKRSGLTDDAQPLCYLPWTQATIVAPTLTIRTAGDPLNLAASLRASLLELDRNVPLFRVRTMESLVTKAASQPAFQTVLLTSFAAMALLLSALGLYGVLSYMVSQRTVEIGLRVALGAQRSDVMRMILRRGLTLASAGLGIGLAISIVVTRQLPARMLYTITPYDALTFAGVSALLLLVAAIASSVPAYRAAHLDPMQTLRDQ